MGARGWHRRSTVANQPVREAFLAYLAAGNTASDLCRHLGWNVKDTSRLSRRLGVMEHQNSRRNGGGKDIQQHVSVDMAKDICRIMGVDFDDLYDGLLIPEVPACYCSCGEPMRVKHVTGMCGWCLEELELFGQTNPLLAA